MLAIKKIYMDYETAPVGVSHMPQFAWELVSDKKNVKQKSYELQIAKDADFTDLIYNSGKTESEESAHVYAEDASLESGKRYFVRAKASDGQEETDWSETASFVTALAGKMVSGRKAHQHGKLLLYPPKLTIPIRAFPKEPM